MALQRRTSWRRAAERLGALVPRARLHPAVCAWADADVGAAAPWLVALSGGADSLALLLLLWQHWPAQRERLVAAHFNHRLRGAAADRDEAFCRRVCRSLGVAWRGGRWEDVPRTASEGAARAARHAFFGRVMSAAGARALWLGHQQDDVAETMLMRIGRGSGTGGLSAPRPVHAMERGTVHLRPLLSLRKKEIERALREAGGRWRSDASNASERHWRNRVRHRVLPAWCAAAEGRDALAGAALTRELLEEDDAALNAWLAELRPLTASGALRVGRLRGKPRALVRRALHAWLAQNQAAADLSRQAFNALVNAVMGGRPTTHSIGANTFAVLRGTQLKFVRQSGKKSHGFQGRSN